MSPRRSDGADFTNRVRGAFSGQWLTILVVEVLIVGGGIGGLATAIALRRAGHEVQVLERASQAAEVGAELAIWPNGRRALGALGAGEARGLPVLRLQLRSWRGRLLGEMPLAELKGRYGFELILMHGQTCTARCSRLSGATRSS